MKILIVDDDENDRLLLKRSLRQFTGRLLVAEAAGGKEAICYLNGEGKFADRKNFPFPTFIFLDLKMPAGDGFSVLAHLRKNSQWAIIPTLIFSSSCDLNDVKKAYLAGASAYHTKPAAVHDRDELCRKMIDYWSSTEVPQCDEQGRQLPTESHGKLGERIG